MPANSNGADSAIGSRYAKGGKVDNWPLTASCISKGGAIYTCFITWMPVNDPTAGFMCYRNSTLNNQPRCDQVCGLRIPDRNEIPHLETWFQNSGSSHCFHRPQGGEGKNEQRHFKRRHTGVLNIRNGTACFKTTANKSAHWL